jgi:hypothetical protein
MPDDPPSLLAAEIELTLARRLRIRGGPITDAWPIEDDPAFPQQAGAVRLR